ncbi:MAG: T9SS type A sorting domain-containing protein, partial [Bacteroidales bacterium]|nr:T9SS type A sorting domain-containing protein [Bacteroidales bacterium]
AYDYTSHCYPIQNLTINVKGNERNVTWNAPEKGNPIGYNVYVNNELVLENTTELSYNTTSNDDVFFVEVVALYENDKTSVGLAKKYAYGDNIIEHNVLQCSVYPNPVNNKLYIVTEDEVENVVVYDIYGRLQVTETASHQDNVAIDVANLKSGIYFVKINTEKGNIVKRIIKQ